MDACANDADIAAALAAVDEADSATLALAEGAAGAAPAASTGAVVAVDAENPNNNAADDADSSAADNEGQPATAAAAVAAAFERPSDEDILAQENEIRAQIAGSAALIGKKEPLSALQEEYSSEGGSVFANKAKSLGRRYSFLRRARGDGNCFFRSFMFALAEGLLERRDLAERNRVVTRIRQSAKKMTDAGFDAIVFEDALEAWCDQLNRIGISRGGPAAGGEPLSLQELEAASSEDSGGLADMAVMLLRLLTSAELRSRADFFTPFVLADDDDGLDGRICDVPSFCARRVEPMGCESDHVHIVALTDVLGVAVRVEYLDRSEEEEGGNSQGGQGGGGGGRGGGGGNPNPNHHDFVPEGAEAPRQVVLLYRPGHYDILYPAV